MRKKKKERKKIYFTQRHKSSPSIKYSTLSSYKINTYLPVSHYVKARIATSLEIVTKCDNSHGRPAINATQNNDNGSNHNTNHSRLTPTHPSHANARHLAKRGSKSRPNPGYVYGEEGRWRPSRLINKARQHFLFENDRAEFENDSRNVSAVYQWK